MTDEQGYLKPKPGFATTAVHAGQNPDKWNGAVVPPVVMSTMYKQAPEGHKGYVYSRSANPMRDTLQECLAALEGAKYAFTFSSGQGATTSITSLLNKGDHLVSIDDVYGGTSRLMRENLPRHGIDVTFTDITDLDKLENAIQDNTKFILDVTDKWCGNTDTEKSHGCAENTSLKSTDKMPVANWYSSNDKRLTLVDIAATVQLVKKRGDIIVVVDNTFLTCYLQRPLDFGADIVMYSLTKYMNGHSDVVMGAAVLNRQEIADKLRIIQKCLTSHKGHEVSKRQTSGHSGVFSFRHTGGLKESRKLLSCFKVFILAESLGGYESLAEIPSIMTHKSVPPPQKAQLGITDSLVRFSIGLEDPEDLIADLENAFKETFNN
ncbi:hypothetical protein HF086_016340 [Spodoptera exigua]|uniref:cystathionine gamma-lyase n=1 Tax=Spodoptera exigua TaxID=7107 RepID=A0A922MRS0_SPOEX|nr:hypothetical protein HF086_016340 [Spodoptera exigua]